MPKAALEIHPCWGWNITQYPGLYSSEADATNDQIPIYNAKRAEWRELAIDTIKEICMLRDSNIKPHTYNNLVTHITLEKIEATLETACFQEELENFLSPMLIAGCIELISTVEPSSFYYEYGYTCFKIMNIALSICSIRQACESHKYVSAIKEQHNDAISALWELTALVLINELTSRTEKFQSVSTSKPLQQWAMPLLDKSRLNQTLSMLHSDQKNFTIALMGTKNLGLAGLMYVLGTFGEGKR